MARLPDNVIHGRTKQINDKAKELLASVPDIGEALKYDIYVTATRRGRTSYKNLNLTVPKWTLEPHRVQNTVRRKLGLINDDLLNDYWVYYLAHELAHAASNNMGHGATFMSKFIEICPPELQFFELNYKPKLAKSAGISIGN